MNVHTREASKGIDYGEEDTAMDIDEIFALLSNSRRRAMLRILFEHERMDFSELVNRVAEIEYGLDIEEISRSERQTIYVSLAQSHRPRLEQNDVIECEQGGSKVSLGPNAEVMAEWISKIDGPDTFTGKLKQVFA